MHIGANCTDDDRLLKSILKNGDVLSAHGAKAPGPGKYRRLIRETLQNLDGKAPAPNTRQILLDAILDEEDTNRLVMSNENFICIPNRIFEGGVFYAQAVSKCRGLGLLFPDDDIEIFLGMRDPATFLPAVYSEAKANDFSAFLQGMELGDIRWSDVLSAIQAALPKARITVWCNEDTPLIWAELIRTISGLPPDCKISGGYDLLSRIMSEEGMKRFAQYLIDHPPKTTDQQRRIIGAFLDKYALPGAIEEEVDLPGFDEATVAALTAQYDEDVAQIAQSPGITFISS